jgi:hypothetical protein
MLSIYGYTNDHLTNASVYDANADLQELKFTGFNERPIQTQEHLSKD